jgi:hypothetical protein
MIPLGADGCAAFIKDDSPRQQPCRPAGQSSRHTRLGMRATLTEQTKLTAEVTEEQQRTGRARDIREMILLGEPAPDC